MQRLCFKVRKDGRTVQLVRHAYCPERRRSRTVTLGSVPIDADPHDFDHVLRLADGATLDEADREQLAVWLLIHGDRDAAARRQAASARIKAETRRAVEAERAAQDGDVFDRALRAMHALVTALPEFAVAERQAGREPWASLRPRYLAVSSAAAELVAAAQASGIAKKPRRRKA